MTTAAPGTELLASAFDLLPTPVFVKDAAGVYRLCNRVFAQEIFGLEPEAVLGRTVLELADTLGPERASLYQRKDLELMAAGGCQVYRGPVRCAGGQERHYEFRKTVLVDGSGEPTGLIGVMVDVTARHQAEQQLASALEEAQGLNQELSRHQAMLVQAEKLSSLGQLAAGIAHEINNPLAFVTSNLGALGDYLHELTDAMELASEVTAEDLADVPAAARLRQILGSADLAYVREDAPGLLADCRDGAERMRKIVLGLKGFARKDDAEPVPSDLNALVDTAVLLARNRWKGHCEVQKRYSELPPVVCHPHQIEQVALNLVLNAAQAVTAGGRITIVSEPAGDGVRLTIADDGPGIGPDVIGRVFEPFFTTKPQDQGTGLGLHIVRSIVERHGGSIGVVSEPGHGATFTVDLPRTPPASPASR